MNRGKYKLWALYFSKTAWGRNHTFQVVAEKKEMIPGRGNWSHLSLWRKFHWNFSFFLPPIGTGCHFIANPLWKSKIFIFKVKQDKKRFLKMFLDPSCSGWIKFLLFSNRAALKTVGMKAMNSCYMSGWESKEALNRLLSALFLRCFPLPWFLPSSSHLFLQWWIYSLLHRAS